MLAERLIGIIGDGVKYHAEVEPLVLGMAAWHWVGAGVIGRDDGGIPRQFL